jgi:hypothetical protein
MYGSGDVRVCELCQMRFKTGSGLASHRRQKHPAFKGPNRKAIDKVIKSLESAPDAATAQSARSIADILDVDPTNANMWRTYRDVIGDLVRGEDAGANEADSDIAEIRSLSKVGHLKAL